MYCVKIWFLFVVMYGFLINGYLYFNLICMEGRKLKKKDDILFLVCFLDW